jgi:3'-5' exoribonuclease
MRRLYLRDARPGDQLDDVFVFNNKQIATTNTGKFYIKAFIGDKTSQVTARMWNASQELFQKLPESGFVRVFGRVENYQGNLQIIMDRLSQPADGSYEIDDLLPCTKKDVKQMFARLTELCGSISNRHLMAVVQAFLDDEQLMANFRRAPAAMSFHHAFIGGLLEHT